MKIKKIKKNFQKFIFKKIIKPTEEEIKKHKEYLKNNL